MGMNGTMYIINKPIPLFVFINDLRTIRTSAPFRVLRASVTSLNSTVNSEIFVRILFSRIALKDMFAMFKIHD